MPDAFRRERRRTDRADAKRPGQANDHFIEGLSLATGKLGRLPHAAILRRVRIPDCPQ